MVSVERIQLVGFANNDPVLQEYLGQFCFMEDVSCDNPAPSYPVVICYDGHTKERYRVTNVRFDDNEVTITVPDWFGAEGLSISYDNKKKTGKFTTGIHSGYQSGTSGILAFGGEQLFKVLRERCPNVEKVSFPKQ